MKRVTGSIFCTSTWKFSSSFGICFCSPCSAVGLRGFGHRGQGTTSSPRTWPLACATSTAAPAWPWEWAGKDQGVFQAGMGLESLCVWGMHDLPPALTQYIPHVWGLKWNPFTSSLLSRAFCRHSFILHCITYIKTRAEKFLLGPFFFFLFYDSAWISKHFRIRQGEKEKVLAAFI